jgi:hypothetical protein
MKFTIVLALAVAADQFSSTFAVAAISNQGASEQTFLGLRGAAKTLTAGGLSDTDLTDQLFPVQEDKTVLVDFSVSTVNLGFTTLLSNPSFEVFKGTFTPSINEQPHGQFPNPHPPGEGGVPEI